MTGFFVFAAVLLTTISTVSAGTAGIRAQEGHDKASGMYTVIAVALNCCAIVIAYYAGATHAPD